MGVLFRFMFFFGRALFIFSLLTFAAVRFVIGWLFLRLLFQPKTMRQEWFGRCMVNLFRRLGATFIKVGQILSTRPDLLPPYLIRALEELQDRVGPFSYRAVERTLAEELGRPVEEVFAEIEPEPIASASVAQVHRARLPDGRVVAVKVRRPRLDQLVGFDLAVMRLGARVIELVPSLRLLAPVETVDEFGRGIRMQLDFTIEAANNRRFRKNFAGDPEVVFPSLVEELCTGRVLVMDFIDGVKILQFRDTQADPKRLAQLGFRILLKMVFQDGFVHADLHPGNLLITRDDKMALLDLGLVGELDARHRAGFASYFAAWSQADGASMARLMADLSPSRHIPDYAGYEAAVVEFVRRYQGKRLGEMQASAVYLDMMNILRRFRVRVNPVFTLVNLAIGVTEGIAKQLDPSVDLLQMAAPFFATLNFSTAAANA